jgi:hypothetical protein
MTLTTEQIKKKIQDMAHTVDEDIKKLDELKQKRMSRLASS